MFVPSSEGFIRTPKQLKHEKGHFYSPGGVAIPEKLSSIPAFLTRNDGPDYPVVKRKDYFQSSVGGDRTMDRDASTTKNPCNV